MRSVACECDQGGRQCCSPSSCGEGDPMNSCYTDALISACTVLNLVDRSASHLVVDVPTTLICMLPHRSCASRSPMHTRTKTPNPQNSPNTTPYCNDCFLVMHGYVLIPRSLLRMCVTTPICQSIWFTSLRVSRVNWPHHANVCTCADRTLPAPQPYRQISSIANPGTQCS